MPQLTPHQSEALNTKRSLSLTANAGSGKTFVLAKRFLEILFRENVPLNKVAAITFTERAAGELYKKIADELNHLNIETVDENKRRRIESVRKQLVSAKISTIHSFCIDLLKEFPVEASIDANFIPVDTRTANELIELSIEEVIRSHLSNPENTDEVKSLIRLLGSKKALMKELSGLVWKRKIVEEIEKNIYNGTVEETADKLYRLFIEEAEKILNIEKPEFIKHLRLINQLVIEHKNNNEIAIRVNEILEKLGKSNHLKENISLIVDARDIILTKNKTIKSREYLPGKLRYEIQSAVILVENFLNDFKQIEINKNHRETELELAKFGKSILLILNEVLIAYENKKSASGYLDFEDILLKTKKVLKNDEVIISLRKKYSFILVDEYQDTNELQYKIFLPIVNYLQSGNLFVVGDEKQSIYRFRDAELEVFNKTKEDIISVNGKESLLVLPDSFRMSPANCLFTNVLFKNLFKNAKPLYGEVETSGLVCAKTENLESKIEFLISEKELEISQAELTANKILQIQSENQNVVKMWNDIAVLVRKRSAFAELEQAFTKYKIPYTVIGGTGFYQQQSISDIYNYFAFLFNTKDDAALNGVFRSPFFSVPDTKIFSLSLTEGNSYWDKLAAASKNDEYWFNIFSILNENLLLSKRAGIPGLLRKILSESGFISVISSRPNGIQEIANVNKIISLTINFFTRELKTLYDYVNFLKDAIESYEDEAQAGIESGTNSVNLLTIHQAKGLEFPAVILYKCDDITRTEQVKSKSFNVDKKFGLLTKVPHLGNYFDSYLTAPVVGLYNFLEAKKNLAELKRLLYVGITRAKNFLFISAMESKKSNSFINLIQQGLNTDLSGNEIIIEDELEYLRQENNKYQNVIEKLKITIPVLRKIEFPADKITKEEETGLKFKNYIDKISDHSKGEIISATKFSVFLNCPLKYNLTYNFNLADLVSVLQAESKYQTGKKHFEYNSKEFNSRFVEEMYSGESHANLKGKLIHKILEKETGENDIEDLTNSFLNQEVFLPDLDEKTIRNFMESIKNDVKIFYSSEEYKFISSFRSYKNEFEAYLKEDDYYLYGIIDKLIISDKKIIIVDYKTDFVTENLLNKKAENYLPQMRFYAYIISRLFPDAEEIEIRLVFIRMPEIPFVTNFNAQDKKEIKMQLKGYISSIREENFSVNLHHCNECVFADNNNKCIIKEQ